MKKFPMFAMLACTATAAGLLLICTPKVEAFRPPPATTLDPPTISCGSSTAVSININVCAGASGAPAGFSIQWVTAASFAANGCSWAGLSGNPNSGYCHASFSGNASGSNYNLAPNACITVNIGELLFDNGASTNCDDIYNNGLLCGTEYVFRAFAHATTGKNGLKRSDFTCLGDGSCTSSDSCLRCATLNCCEFGCEEGCTYTQGYWKTHGPEGCLSGNNSNFWPVDSLTLGTVAYTDAELCSILNTPASGNGLIGLAHQLIAAKLNVANGADDTDVAAAIAAADALIGGLVAPPVGTGSLANSATSALVDALATYNEGGTGPGHCD